MSLQRLIQQVVFGVEIFSWNVPVGQQGGRWTACPVLHLEWMYLNGPKSNIELIKCKTIRMCTNTFTQVH